VENLARYIIRASFSQERMHYMNQEGKVVYAAKHLKSLKVFPAMEWLAVMCSHIPNWGEQMVRYKDYVTLLETSVQLVIVTSIENRKPLTCR
jgi:hypothetical protein